MPLHGLKILDISSLIAGPTSCGLLSDFGAEVIKVELPVVGDAMRQLPPHKNNVPLWWKVTNRNKQAITLDIRTKKGKEIFLQLLKKVDVLVESFRPGTMDKYGLGVDTLQKIHPRLIILKVSGFGQTGTLHKSPGFARIAEAFSGFTAICGEENGPPMHLGYPLADSITGLFGALGIMMACYYQKNNNDVVKGEVIDLSLVDSMIRIIEFLIIEYDQLNISHKRSGSCNLYAAPSNIFKSKDNQWFSLSASTQNVFERACIAIDKPDFITKKEFADNKSRVKNMSVLNEELSNYFQSKNLTEILELLHKHDVPASKINSAQDLVQNEHLNSRGSIVSVLDDELGEVKMPSVTPFLRNSPGKIKNTGPALGQDNMKVYKELLNLDDEQIAELKKTGVI